MLLIGSLGYILTYRKKKEGWVTSSIPAIKLFGFTQQVFLAESELRALLIV